MVLHQINSESLTIVEFERDAPRTIDCHRIALGTRVQRMSFVSRAGQVGQVFGFIKYFQHRGAASAELRRNCRAATRFEKLLESFVAEALDHGWHLM